MLIAQYGDSVRQPENTLSAFEAAHGLGACAIATEIQFSADGTPWCFHRDALVSPDGHKRPLYEVFDRDLRQLSLPEFTQLVDWGRRHPHLDWFVELRPEVLQRLGTDIAVTRVVEHLLPESGSFALLTDDCRSLRLARSLGCHRVALKVRSVAQSLSAEAVTLAPDYLLIRDSQVDCQELPPGPWQWVVYEINSPEAAVHWRTRGAHHILTANLPLLMRSREASDVYGF